MKRITLTLFLFVTIASSCKQRPNKASVPSPTEHTTKPVIDTVKTNIYVYEIEQRFLSKKRNLSEQLGLYDLEKGTKNFELHIWQFPSMWDPSILYILKLEDSTWTLFHYQYYRLRLKPDNNGHPIIDSVRMESVRPQKTTWADYIQRLQLDSLWMLETESAIKGKDFDFVDGSSYLAEFSDKGKYKYLFYTQPSFFQNKDINHKKIIEFQKRLIDPIIFNGMINP